MAEKMTEATVAMSSSSTILAHRYVIACVMNFDADNLQGRTAGVGALSWHRLSAACCRQRAVAVLVFSSASRPAADSRLARQSAICLKIRLGAHPIQAVIAFPAKVNKKSRSSSLRCSLSVSSPRGQLSAQCARHGDKGISAEGFDVPSLTDRMKRGLSRTMLGT